MSLEKRHAESLLLKERWQSIQNGIDYKTININCNKILCLKEPTYMVSSLIPLLSYHKSLNLQTQLVSLTTTQCVSSEIMDTACIDQRQLAIASCN